MRKTCGAVAAIRQVDQRPAILLSADCRNECALHLERFSLGQPLADFDQRDSAARFLENIGKMPIRMLFAVYGVFS